MPVNKTLCVNFTEKGNRRCGKSSVSACGVKALRHLWTVQNVGHFVYQNLPITSIIWS